jgi:hypothetical protein
VRFDFLLLDHLYRASFPSLLSVGFFLVYYSHDSRGSVNACPGLGIVRNALISRPSSVLRYPMSYSGCGVHTLSTYST